MASRIPTPGLLEAIALRPVARDEVAKASSGPGVPTVVVAVDE